MANITDWSHVPIIFDIPMAARILGATPEGVKKRCQRGELPAYKEGKLWRFEKESFQDYIRQRQAAIAQRSIKQILRKDGESA